MRFSKWKFKNFLADVFDLLAFLVFVWGIVLFIRFFIANPYTVVWSSMSPTFEENDFIIVDKITPRFGQLQRWDVIVFVPPGKNVPYIKRIIWLPWETVKIHDWWIYICNSWAAEDCKKLQESYLPEYVTTEARCGKEEFKIESWFFVMWDNRWFSTDSLCCFGLGCFEWANYTVPSNYMIWKVYVRIIPNFKAF
jgi:signal peptidase I